MGIYVGIILVLALMISLTAVVGRTEALEERKAQEEQQLQASISMGYALAGKLEEISAFRHDLKGYLQTVAFLMNRRSITEEGAKVAGEESVRSKSRSICDRIADAMLDYKEEQCRKEGISFQVHRKPLETANLPAEEFAALLQNVLDNALEANERIPAGEERFLRADLSEENGKIRLIVENPAAGDEKAAPGFFKTSKEDSRMHGIGISVVRRIVEDHDGTFAFRQENGCVTVEVVE